MRSAPKVFILLLTDIFLELGMYKVENHNNLTNHMNNYKEVLQPNILDYDRRM